MRRTFCDQAKDWAFDEDGSYETAPEIESCPDFELDPAMFTEEIAAAVMDIFPEEFNSVGVYQEGEGTVVPVFHVNITLCSNLPMDTRRKLILEVKEALQELNNDVLHVQDAEFKFTMVYKSTSNNPDVPDFLPDDL